MTPKSWHLVAILLVTLALADTGCGGRDDGSPAAPSSVPSVVQGTVALGVFQLAVVTFRVDRAGSLSSRVDWNDANNDIDTVLLRGRCTVDQILAEVAGCNEMAAIATDESLTKPSVLSPSVQSGDHTLVIFNWGPGTDTSSYRLEGFVSEATSPTTSPPASSSARRTDTFAFSLPAGSTAQLSLGPVFVGNGPLEVTLSFAGDFVLAVCVGTHSLTIPCIPLCAPCQLGGQPITRFFNIPGSFAAGPIRALVWFNPNYPQPPGDASGTVTFTYNPL